MKCRPACVWRREDEGDWNVSASGVFDLQISKKSISCPQAIFKAPSALQIGKIHKAGINLQNWELRVGLPLQKLPCLHFKQTENWSWYTFTLVPKNAEPSAHHTSSNTNRRNETCQHLPKLAFRTLAEKFTIRDASMILPPAAMLDQDCGHGRYETCPAEVEHPHAEPWPW